MFCKFCPETGQPREEASQQSESSSYIIILPDFDFFFFFFFFFDFDRTISLGFFSLFFSFSLIATMKIYVILLAYRVEE